MENETNPEPCKSLLLFIPSLSHSAGMERASTTVANALTRRGYRVAFAVLVLVSYASSRVLTWAYRPLRRRVEAWMG